MKADIVLHFVESYFKIDFLSIHQINVSVSRNIKIFLYTHIQCNIIQLQRIHRAYHIKTIIRYLQKYFGIPSSTCYRSVACFYPPHFRWLTEVVCNAAKFRSSKKDLKRYKPNLSYIYINLSF